MIWFPWTIERRYKHKTVLEILKELAQENNVPGWETMKPRELIEATKEYFFDFEFPIYEFKESYEQWSPSIAGKGDFETKFLKHFLYERIGFEDVEQFFVNLDEAINSIMPYYNQRLASEEWFPLYIKNPSANTDYTESYTREIQGNNESTGSSKTTNNETETTSDQSNANTNGQTTDTSETTNNDTTNVSTSGSMENTTGQKSNDTSTQTNTQKNTTLGNDTPLNMLDDTDYASSITDTDVSGTVTNTGQVESTGSTAQTNEGTEETTVTGETNTTAKTTSESISQSQSNGNRSLNGSSDTTTGTKGTNNQLEVYTFNRIGNIGIQTPGEVFSKTREAFINTLMEIFEHRAITTLFDFLS